MAKSPLVWIVDDDEDDQFLFKLAFQQLIPPVLVNQFKDGEELLLGLEQKPTQPDLIILDLNMPRINGFEVLKHLRARPVYELIPVIVLTTSTDQGDRQKAEQLGANGFLTKPPSMETLLLLFRQLVEEWRLA